MTKQVLIAYASVSGSTAEVAEAIGQVLTTLGATVEVCPINSSPDPARFDAIILGSSIRAGRWLPDAQHYFKVHAGTFLEKPTALFTTCLTMVNDTEESRRTVRAYMEPVLHSVPNFKPVGLGLFAGSFDPSRLQLYPFNPDLAPQGDYRDWEAIKQWAAEIGPVLLSKTTESDEIILTRDATLSFADMSGQDLHGVNLHGADLYRAELTEADLQGANLSKTDLTEADLKKADLQEASLNHAVLNWAEMNWADMNNKDLHGANLIGADLHAASLEQTNLSYAILNGANLSHANLRGADLSHTDLNWVNLNGADLREANLTYANLGWANLTGAKLDQANLKNARFNHFTQWPEKFSAQDQGAVNVQIGLY